MGKRLTEEDIKEIQKLHKEGKSVTEIMKITGFGDSTVRKYQEKEKEQGRPVFNISQPWKAHCETCLYAFRKSMKSESTHLVSGCELEIEDNKNCRLWLDTERIRKMPEWVDVKDDLPQLIEENRSVMVRVRLKNGKTADAYCDKEEIWHFDTGEQVNEKNPVIRWRSL